MIKALGLLCEKVPVIIGKELFSRLSSPEIEYIDLFRPKRRTKVVVDTTPTAEPREWISPPKKSPVRSKSKTKKT